MANQSISGFPEWLPGQRIIETHVLDTLRRVFELHGFSGIETRAVEPLSALESKGETSKQVYLLQRLQGAREDAAAGKTASAPGSRDLGLHFDLTVPLARYVVQNASHLDFPLRRYQIQKVWRGERPQEGRFREFTQADIDIVGMDHLSFHHEVEAAQVMLSALDAIQIPPVLMEVNNRRLLQGLVAAAGIEDFEGTLRALDKLDKIGAEGVAAELAANGLNPEQTALVVEIASISATNAADLRAQVGELNLNSDLIDRGLDELCDLLTGASATAERLTGDSQVRASLRIARGLDYYTGSVYETIIPGYESLGSVCSGGRYDTLVSQGRRTYPGVGLSIGVTRLVSLILSENLLVASRPTPTAVFVAVNVEEDRAASEAVAVALRERGVSTEVSPKAQKFGRQIQAADKRGIPYVWFPPAGDEGTHQVKDIRSGDQTEANPETWTPPEEDLFPKITPRV